MVNSPSIVLDEKIVWKENVYLFILHGFNNNTNSILFGTWLNFSKKSNLEWLEFFGKKSDAGITEYFILLSLNHNPCLKSQHLLLRCNLILEN